MSFNAERGSSSLAFVLMLFGLSMMMLGGLQEQYTRQRSQVTREVSFIKQSSQAVSALAWGGEQSWNGQTQWQCQHAHGQGWRACLLVTDNGKALLAAHGKTASGAEQGITLWRWGKLEDALLVASAHGWLDFCPLKEAAQCILPR